MSAVPPPPENMSRIAMLPCIIIAELWICIYSYHGLCNCRPTWWIKAEGLICIGIWGAKMRAKVSSFRAKFQLVVEGLLIGLLLCLLKVLNGDGVMLSPSRLFQSPKWWYVFPQQKYWTFVHWMLIMIHCVSCEWLQTFSFSNDLAWRLRDGGQTLIRRLSS